jgi:phosphodiesterase/alkaline phosphatase D-like protein
VSRCTVIPHRRGRAAGAALRVQCAVATDDRFRRVVARGEAFATADVAPAVHVEPVSQARTFVVEAGRAGPRPA